MVLALPYQLQVGEVMVLERWPRVVVIDVGSPRNDKLGWYSKNSCGSFESGTSLKECVGHLARSVRERPLALGFEAPTYIPTQDEPDELLKARSWEGSHSWSAGAGSTVLVTGLAVALYVFSRLKQEQLGVTVTFRPGDLRPDARQILLFEAFVSGSGTKAKSTSSNNPHIEDAKSAVEAFERLQSAGKLEPLDPGRRCLNLLGACLLQSGLTDTPDVLDVPCIVVRASK